MHLIDGFGIPLFTNQLNHRQVGINRMGYELKAHLNDNDFDDTCEMNRNCHIAMLDHRDNLHDGFVLFSSPVEVNYTSCLIGHSFFGPFHSPSGDMYQKLCVHYRHWDKHDEYK